MNLYRIKYCPGGEEYVYAPGMEQVWKFAESALPCFDIELVAENVDLTELGDEDV